MHLQRAAKLRLGSSKSDGLAVVRNDKLPRTSTYLDGLLPDFSSTCLSF